MTEHVNHAPASPLVRMLRAAWNLVQAAILLYGLAVAGYLLARLAVGECWNWIAFANNFIPWWALGNVIAGGIALAARRRWLLVACQLPGMVAFVLIYGELLLPQDPPAEATATSRVTAATYNIIASVSDAQRVKDVIIELDADVIGLQELGPDHAAVIASELSDLYPYQALYPGLPVSGVGLLSRYPILQDEMFQPLPGSMFYLRAVLEVDGVSVVVYVVHPPPPYQAVSPLSYDDARRDAEITILRQDYLRHETEPLLVVGDFNMADQSDAYRWMDDLLDDAFREVGHGLGFTFPDTVRWTSAGVFPLLLRIDYIWYNTDFTAHSVRVGADSGTSDHRPVWAELSLNAARAD